MRKTQSCPTRGKREGIVALHLFFGGPSRPILRYHSAESWLGSAEMIVARRSFRGNAFRTVQELHLWQGCRKHEYPANTEHNVTHRIGLRTKMVSWWRKLNWLFLPNQHANRGSLESIFLAELVLEKAEIGGRDIVRMTDKQRKDRWLCRDLSYEGGLGDFRRFTFPHRQGVGGEDLLEKLVQCSGRDPF